MYDLIAAGISSVAQAAALCTQGFHKPSSAPLSHHKHRRLHLCSPASDDAAAVPALLCPAMTTQLQQRRPVLALTASSLPWPRHAQLIFPPPQSTPPAVCSLPRRRRHRSSSAAPHRAPSSRRSSSAQSSLIAAITAHGVDLSFRRPFKAAPCVSHRLSLSPLCSELKKNESDKGKREARVSWE